MHKINHKMSNNKRKFVKKQKINKNLNKNKNNQ